MNAFFTSGLTTSNICGTLIERVGWVLIHSVWQYALVAFVAWLTVWAMRGFTASARYNLLVAAMAVSTGMPIATWMIQSGEVVDQGSGRRASSLLHISNVAADKSGRSPTSFGLQDLQNEAMREGQINEFVSQDSASGNSLFVRALVPAVDGSNPSWFERAKTVVRPWLMWIVTAWIAGVIWRSVGPVRS